MRAIGGGRRGGAVGSVRQDLAQTARTLARAPGFAVVAILSLALGIGVTTAVVSIVDHVLLHALPFRDPGRLMMMLERDERGGFRTPSAPTVADWKQDPGAARAFDAITFQRGDGATLTHGDAREPIAVAYVEPDFFSVLGARPGLGRALVADDHRRDAPNVAVISDALWHRAFGGDRRVIGRRVLLDSMPTVIVGVMPVGGGYPGWADVWQPLSHYAQQSTLMQRGLHVDSRTIGRLKPGVDSARAMALMRPVDARLAAAYPEDQAHWRAAMMPVRDDLLGDIGPTLYTLAGAAVAVLLLTCANVANLLLARVASRRTELAVRSALGASRGRLVRQLLAESVALSAIGGALGVAVAALAITLARKLPPGRLPRVDELGLDHRVLIVALGASLITTLVCGLWPAIQASRPAYGDLLRGGGRGSLGVRSETRTRRALVTVQFALALVLLVGAGLLLQSFRRALRVDVGFDPQGLVAVKVNPALRRYPAAADAAALYARLIAAARAVPGVEDAAFIQHVPFAAASIYSPIEIDGQPATDAGTRQVLYRTVSDTYLRTMKMRMAAGRWFDDADMRSPGGAFVINQALARRYWAGGDAVGKRIVVHRSSQARADFGEPLAGVVIGVVADVHQVRQDVTPEPEVYVPYTLEPWNWGTIVVRARDAARVVPALREAVTAVDPQLIERGPAGDARFTVVARQVESALAPRKLSIWLIGAFAGCALVLAAIGMYGVVAYGIARRTRELGVRKALGATDARIARLVLVESLALAAVGVAIGCVGAWGATRFIRDQLFDTTPIDLPAYAATISLLVGIALLATYLPARRAMRLDPSIAMRGD